MDLAAELHRSTAVSGDALFIDAEMIAPRTDIPLADLDGGWEGIYYQPATKVETICAAPLPANAATWESGLQKSSFLFRSTNWVRSDAIFEDFFLVDDARYSKDLTQPPPIIDINVVTTLRNLEVSLTERSNANAIAVPEIYVSRINPRSTGYAETRTSKTSPAWVSSIRTGIPGP